MVKLKVNEGFEDDPQPVRLLRLQSFQSFKHLSESRKLDVTDVVLHVLRCVVILKPTRDVVHLKLYVLDCCTDSSYTEDVG